MNRLRTTTAPEALRRVEASEIAALAELWHSGWQIGHAAFAPEALKQIRTRDTFRDRIRANLADCHVTGPVGAITGFIMIKGAELSQFYVAPERIGRGDAPGLMALAEALMVTRGVREAFLIASVGNDRAMRFYDRCGWTRACTRREIVPGGHEMDVVRFEKVLSGASDVV